jgi:hypothetical protein
LACTEVFRALSQTRDYIKAMILGAVAGYAGHHFPCVLRDSFAHSAVKGFLPQRSERRAAKFAKKSMDDAAINPNARLIFNM